MARRSGGPSVRYRPSRAVAVRQSAAASVTPWFHRWCRYGVNLSCFDSRLVALPSSSSMLPTRANRSRIIGRRETGACRHAWLCGCPVRPIPGGIRRGLCRWLQSSFHGSQPWLGAWGGLRQGRRQAGSIMLAPTPPVMTGQTQRRPLPVTGSNVDLLLITEKAGGRSRLYRAVSSLTPSH
jgi:hypothetical protein